MHFSTANPQDNKEDEKPPGKLKELIRKYGAVAVVVHLSTYTVTLFGIFLGVSSKVIDVASTLSYIHDSFLGGFFGDADFKTTSKTGDFAAAWILTKFTEPVRLPLTVYLTPKVANHPAVKAWRAQQQNSSK
jgi:hypothetical protein